MPRLIQRPEAAATSRAERACSAGGLMPPGACGVWSGPAAAPPPPVRLPSPLPRQQPAAAPPAGVCVGWAVAGEAMSAPLDRPKKGAWCGGQVDRAQQAVQHAAAAATHACPEGHCHAQQHGSGSLRSCRQFAGCTVLLQLAWKGTVTQKSCSAPEWPLRVTVYEPGGVMAGNSCEYRTCTGT